MKRIVFFIAIQVVGLVLIELSLRGVAAVAAWSFKRRPGESSASKVIVTLGESRTASIPFGPDFSWPTLLQHKFDQQNVPIKIDNRARVGSTSPVLVNHLLNDFNLERIDLVVAMMGVNDRPEFWVRDHFLVHEDGFWKQLRIYRLARFLISSIRNEVLRRKRLEIDPALYPRKQEFLERKRSGKSVADLERSIAEMSSEKRAQVYGQLAIELKPSWKAQGGMFYDSRYYAKKALEASPFLSVVPWLYLHEVSKTGQEEQCSWLADRFLEAGVEPTEEELFKFATCDRNSPIIKKLFNQAGSQFQIGETKESPTKMSFKALHDFLLKRKICLIAVQYPRRKINALKMTFDNTDLVYFVENESEFEQILKTEPYDSLFTDHFAGNFGHATQRGNQIIANNVESAIRLALADPKCQNASVE